MKKIAILTLSIILNLQVIAQENYKKCLTTSLVEKEIISNTDYAKSRANIISENKIWIKNNSKEKNTMNIPVVVHIIHRNTYTQIGQGNNISNAQIEDALKILNEDYSKTNPEYPNPPRNTFINKMYQG